VQRQPWIYSPLVDSVFIITVPFVVVAITLLLPTTFAQADSMTVVSWAVLVMGVDVSHVYSTLYRTYFDRETHREHRTFLYLLPFAVFVVCMALYSQGALTFWRIMAYLAVFHFARQQYGFMRVYGRSEVQTKAERRLDALTIYAATFYPIIDWHFAGPKSFNWFMKGDFLYIAGGAPARAVLAFLYFTVILLYLLKEIRRSWRSQSVNLPRNGIIAGTFLSWYVGIVHFNSDLAFTAINVISHGVPYMALVWIWGNKKYNPPAQKGAPLTGGRWGVVFRPRYVALFVVSLLILAYVEEGFWNTWVWHDKEHAGLFSAFHRVLGDLGADSPWLKILVPLLSVPQVTHYVIDGFIWKLRRDTYQWRDITLAGLAPVVNKEFKK